jgi:glycine cleavage system H protein
MSSEFLQYVVDKFIFKVKTGLLYTEDDLWVNAKNGAIQIGVSDFLQRRGGDIVFVELPRIGYKVAHGEELAQLETIKAVISLKSPMNGTVTEANSELADKPEKINEDPYGEGWLVTVSEPKQECATKNLLAAEQYFELMKLKIQDDIERSKEAGKAV